jgi:SLT domain-containing protein
MEETAVELPGDARRRAPYEIRWTIFADGERHPVLLHAETGLPLFFPSAFATAHLRARGMAANTIDRCLRALAFLSSACDRWRAGA